MTFEGFPIIVGWELTLSCNLACRHCGSSAGSARPNELTLDESLDLCHQFPELLVQEVNFTGGEPLLHPGWSELATQLSKLGIPTKMVTNGLLVSKDAAARMVDSGIIEIGVSVDGPEEQHDHVRGRAGCFRGARAGIEHARAAGLDVSIITTVHSANVRELPSLADEILRLGVSNWQIQPIFPFGRACLNEGLYLSDTDYQRLGRFVLEHQPRLEKSGLTVSPADSFGYFTDYDTRTPEWRGCPAGIASCGITSDGKIKGCLSFPQELTEGDLRKRDLWEIWFSDDAFEFNRNFDPSKLGSSCAGCEKGDQCRGGCSAMSYATTGSFHNDPLCFHRIKDRSRRTTRCGSRTALMHCDVG